MATLFIDGFDKYGPAGTNFTPLVFANEWTSFTLVPQGSNPFNNETGTATIAAPLGLGGQAVTLQSNGDGFGGSPLCTLLKTLTQYYTRLIGGFRITVSSTSGYGGISFYRDTTYQIGVQLYSGVVIVTTIYGLTATVSNALASGGTVVAGQTYYVEYDITIGGGGSPFRVWLNGQQIINGTGNTNNAGYGQANYIGLIALGCTATYDDLYLFDSTTTVNNTVLGTNPRIVTQIPISNSQVQFTSSDGLTDNYAMLSTADGDSSFIKGITVGSEDLYNFPALPVTSQIIITTAVKAWTCNAGVATTHNIELHTASGSVDSAGSAGALVPITAYAYLTSFFDVDPNTNQPWSITNYNAAVSGIKIVS
jgi:hypothetical protein